MIMRTEQGKYHFFNVFCSSRWSRSRGRCLKVQLRYNVTK